MAKVGNPLEINYLGTHTMRKTGAYRVYEQTGHNIACHETIKSFKRTDDPCIFRTRSGNN